MLLEANCNGYMLNMFTHVVANISHKLNTDTVAQGSWSLQKSEFCSEFGVFSEITPKLLQNSEPLSNGIC